MLSEGTQWVLSTPVGSTSDNMTSVNQTLKPDCFQRANCEVVGIRLQVSIGWRTGPGKGINLIQNRQLDVICPRLSDSNLQPGRAADANNVIGSGCNVSRLLAVAHWGKSNRILPTNRIRPRINTRFRQDSSHVANYVMPHISQVQPFRRKYYAGT